MRENENFDLDEGDRWTCEGCGTVKTLGWAADIGVWKGRPSAYTFEGGLLCDICCFDPSDRDFSEWALQFERAEEEEDHRDVGGGCDHDVVGGPRLSLTRLPDVLFYALFVYVVIASAGVSSWWIGSAHATWDISAPLLYIQPVVLHLVVALGVWEYARLTTSLARRRAIRHAVLVTTAALAGVAALVSWARSEHLGLLDGLVMATICSLGPVLLCTFFMAEPVGADRSRNAGPSPRPPAP
ncbi:hypothetical protein ACWDT6_19925 [Nocardia grenadensis]